MTAEPLLAPQTGRASEQSPEFSHHKRREFHTLNGLRGIAALLVITIHAPRMFPQHPHHAYLAVDLFFVISGFILSYVYGDRLAQGLPWRSFMRMRILRLAPLYLLALVLSALVLWIDPAGFAHQVGEKIAAVYFVLGLFLLPAHFHSDSSGAPFPYNNVSWTLFLELLMNVVHCTLLRRAGTRTLLLLNAAAALALAGFYAHNHNLNAGWQFRQLFTVGVARVTFSYTAGMLIYQAWKRRRFPLHVPAAISVVLVAVLLTVHTGHDALFALIFVLAALPLIVLASVYNEPGKGFAELFGLLGFTSYGVYVLQTPALEVLDYAAPRFETIRGAGYIFLLCLSLIAYVFTRFYDTPVRAWAERLLKRTRQA